MHGWGEGGDEEDSHVFGGYHSAKIGRICEITKFRGISLTELFIFSHRLHRLAQTFALAALVLAYIAVYLSHTKYTKFTKLASRFALAVGYAECTRPGGKAQASRVRFCVFCAFCVLKDYFIFSRRFHRSALASLVTILLLSFGCAR